MLGLSHCEVCFLSDFNCKNLLCLPKLNPDEAICLLSTGAERGSEPLVRRVFAGLRPEQLCSNIPVTCVVYFIQRINQ